MSPRFLVAFLDSVASIATGKAVKVRCAFSFHRKPTMPSRLICILFCFCSGRYFPPSAKNLTDSTVNSLLTHVMSCCDCPVSIRASLAFLGHRAIQQKADLSGSWKKNFFQKVWDRLHVDMDWAADTDDDGIVERSETFNHTDMYGEEEILDDPDDDGGEALGEPGDQMNALIKAAAIWLTEQDGGNPSKRANDGSPGTADSTEGSGVKRRRAV
jgi:hypothetical protein